MTTDDTYPLSGDPHEEAVGPDGMLLGPYESYNEYLQSNEWHALRDQVLGRDRGKCIDCGRCATEVHHRIYPPHIDQTELDCLVSLCRICHSRRPRTGRQLSAEEQREWVNARLFGNREK